MNLLEQQEEARARLCAMIEEAIGRKMKTPKDFDFLANAIYDKLHEKISSSTLKRIWGYLPETSTPRLGTLDILSQFVNYTDWKSFCAQTFSEKVPESVSSKPRFRSWKLLFPLIVIAIAFVARGLLPFDSDNKNASDELKSDYYLKKGSRFDKPQDYLELFGIHDLDFYWGREVASCPGVFIWGPEYGNSTWGNKGDSAAMMPTITVRWTSPNVTKEQIDRRNSDFFYMAMHRNEIRLTFMKDLVYPGYVFLGVYRLSKEESDSTHNVWERVQDDLYLHDLNQLYKYRN